MAKFNIHVNGRDETVEAEPDTPLLWVLRDKMNLTGTKYGCGKALCGACTIHLNGTATRSCVLPISGVGKNKIVTIEGLSSEGDKRLQESWIKHNVPQCGYCQAGQIMSASALLASNNNPDDTAIDAAMNGNICRCGTYQRIRAAIKDAAAQGEKP